MCVCERERERERVEICVSRVRPGESVAERVKTLQQELSKDGILQLACACLEAAVKGGLDKKRLRDVVRGSLLKPETRALLLEALLVSGPKLTQAERV